MGQKLYKFLTESHGSILFFGDSNGLYVRSHCIFLAAIVRDLDDRYYRLAPTRTREKNEQRARFKEKACEY